MSSVIVKKEKTYKAPVFALLFMLIGTGLLIFSFKELNTYTHKNDSYISTEAHVIKHTYKNGKVSSTIVEYTVQDNKYTIYSKDKLDCIKSYGSVIEVKYNPSNPEEAIFANRSINIVIPITSLVLLSIGFAIIIVMLSDNLRRIKRYSKIITDKKKGYYKSSYNDIKNANQTNNIANNTLINEEQVKEIRELKKEHKKTTNEEQVKEEIIEIPSVNENNSNSSDNINYIDFISNFNDASDTPDFIPNMNELEEKLSNKKN